MHTITVAQIPEYLKRFWEAEQKHDPSKPRMVLLFISYPGVGKTTCCKQFCEWLDANTDQEWVLYDYNLLQSTPEDLRGAVSFLDLEPDLKVTTNCPPQNFPIEGSPKSAGGKNVFIFLDEVKTASTLLQQLGASIIDGRVGDHKIDRNRTFVVLASNPDGTLGTFQTPDNLRNRVCEVHVVADTDEWLEWAYDNKIHPLITSFIQVYPNLLSQPKPETSHGFPSPRVWENMSMFLDTQDVDMSMPEFFLTPVAVGYLGPTVAHEFVNHCVHAAVKLNPRLVFEGKYSELPTKVSDTITLLDACLYILDTWVERATPEQVDELVDPINRFFTWLAEKVDVGLVLNRMSLRTEDHKKRLAQFLFSYPDLKPASEVYSKLCAQAIEKKPSP